MRLKRFSEYINEAKHKGGIPFEIEIDECAFIVKGKPYIIDVIYFTGTAKFGEPEPEVGIFGSTLDEWETQVKSIDYVSKFKTPEIADNFVNLVNNSRFLGMDQKTVSKVASDYLYENDADLVRIEDQAEIDQLVKDLEEINMAADLHLEVLSSNGLDRRIEDAIWDSLENQGGDDDYEEPEDWED